MKHTAKIEIGDPYSISSGGEPWVRLEVGWNDDSHDDKRVLNAVTRAVDAAASQVKGVEVVKP